MEGLKPKYGVADGARTHDNLSHSQGLYQLSYSHHYIYSFVYRISLPVTFPWLIFLQD